MCPDSDVNPEDDIQQAIHQAHNPASASSTEPVSQTQGDVITEAHRCPVMWMKAMVSKCGLMAAKYPWQTTLALLLSVGCGWLCVYFGLTVLAGLIAFAIYSDV